MPFEDVAKKIDRYNQLCLHYNFVAEAVYAELRRSKAPFSQQFEAYLIAALLAFDMGRMMGSGLARRCDATAGGFATRLRQKLAEIRCTLDPIIQCSLIEIDISKYAGDIVKAYETLATDGEGRLSEEEKEFHVGATKILHFLNPELFMIIDSNTAMVLRTTCGIGYRNSTQPGYCGHLYVESLSTVRKLILDYGPERFRALEFGTPLLRIFDKATFAFSL